MNEARFDDADITTGWRRAVRIDRSGKLAKVEKVAGGGVRIPATVARVGIYEYPRRDGGVTREFLPPEEAGRLESLRTLRDAPVTVLHPGPGKRMVSPSTYKADSVGHVSGEPHSDGKTVSADLVVQDAAAIKRVDAGELVEVSPGYVVMLDPTPGEWNGQRYDAVQRRREYNHVAIGPRGWARGGADAALRIDGVDVEDVAVELERERTEGDRPARERRTDGSETMKTERIDGVEFEVGTVAWAQARAKHDTKVESDLAAAEKRAKDAEGERDKLQARVDASDKRVKELEAELAPERLDGRVAARANLVTAARVVLGAEEKLDGKSDLDVMRATLAKACPELKLDGKSDEYVRARFEVETEKPSKPGTGGTSPLGRAREGAVAGGRQDGAAAASAFEGLPPDLSNAYRRY